MLPQNLFSALLQGQVAQPDNFLAPMTPQSVQAPANPLFSNLQQDRENFLNTLATPQPQLPQYQEVSPAFRTPDALKLILGGLLSTALGKNQGLEGFLGGYLGGKEQEANQKQNIQNQNAQIGYQNLVNQANQDRQVAQARLGFSNEDWQRSENERIKDEQLREQNAQKQEGLRYQALSSVQNAFTRSKSLNDMKAKAKQWANYEQMLGLPITAPTDQEVEADFADRSANAVNTINDNWQVAKDRVLQQFGYIPDSQASQLAGYRESLLKMGRQYNPNFTLPDVPTETTLKKQKEDQWLASAKLNDQEKKDLTVQKIASMKANIDRAKERIGLEQQRARIQGFNADTSRMNYELRSQAKVLNKAVQSKIDGISAKIVGLKKAQGGASDILKRRSIQTQIDELSGQRDYWKTQLDPDGNLPPIPSEATQRAAGVSEGSGLYKTKSGHPYQIAG